MKYFAYIRVSTQKQGEGVSLDAQKEAINNFAKQEGFAICRWFAEKETAAKSGRPVFSDMIRRLKKNQADGVLMHRIDRSARNFRDWAAIGELSDNGIHIHFAAESLDFRSRGGRLVADIQMAVASDYCRNLSIETRKGIEGRLKQGLYPFSAPIGYLDQGSGQVKIIDPARAPLIKKLFRLYLSQDHSINSLHKEARLLGLTNKSGQPISRRSIENILNNRFYCGYTRNGRTGEVYPGKHEPLISSADFERVQAIKAGRYVKRCTKHNYQFRRLVRCSLCQRVLTGEKQKGHVYYRCHRKGCLSGTVREDHIEAEIIAKLESLSFDQASMEYLRQKFDEWDIEAETKAEQKALSLQLANLKHKEERLMDILLEQVISKEEYAKQKEALSRKQALLGEKIEKLATERISEPERMQMFELISNLAGLYIMANHRKKRRLAENLFSNFVFDGKYLYIEPSNDLLQVDFRRGVPFGCPTPDKMRRTIDLFNRINTEPDGE